MDQCGCSHLISAAGVDVEDILKARPVRHAILPSLEELLYSRPVAHYPYSKIWDEAQWDPYLVLQTSGSTGLPKPITYNLRVPATVDAQSLLEDTTPADGPGYRRMRPCLHFRGRLLSSFAPFHTIGSTRMLALSVFGETVLVYPFRKGEASAAAVTAAIAHGNPDTAWLSPGVLVQMSRWAAGLSALAKLKRVSYGGSSLPRSAGDLISEQTHLSSIWGSTETGGLVLGQLDASDWDYLSFYPEYNGLEWRIASDRGNDKTVAAIVDPSSACYEPVIVKKKELLAYQAIFSVFPSLEQWRTGDLYTKHPTKPHTWKYAGRSDDMVCLATGNSFHPQGSEDRMTGHGLASGCVIFGQDHLQPVMLIELTEETTCRVSESSRDYDRVEEAIWKLVDSVNMDEPPRSKVARTHIIFAGPAKPFLRTSKGTIQRRATVAAYKDEIEAVYAMHGDVAGYTLGRTGKTGRDC
ncbi:Uu.00g137550.m01.CDS01 [Anthostomella pinea]|uniref:Uu.00g137550.m01.CDS01 n=1 Tax=Anthostomella pinea TaxID=933095 RepID=A0AAI8VQA9_9PEZI|nr:Uu.00g137550.m01.CDS01 [Anthostomella pinea]